MPSCLEFPKQNEPWPPDETLFPPPRLQNGSSEKREVRQFQFMAWPDHGVPEYPTPFLAFLRRVQTCNPPDAGPIIAHCRYEHERTPHPSVAYPVSSTEIAILTPGFAS